MRAALFLLLWAIAAPAFAQDRATLLDETILDLPGNSGFGGLSAIEITAGGTRALLLSDRGRLFALSLERDGPRITEAALLSETLLRGANGARPSSRAAMDSEGMARLPDGRLALSFEGRMRIATHGPDGRETWRLPPPPDAATLPGNGGFEALAADAHGRLYTLAEREPGTGPLTLWRHDGAGWTRFATLPRHRAFRPVALGFDDIGRLTLLERRFSPLGGFAARLSRFDIEGSGLGAPRVVLETRPGTHGNLEGLSLWRDGHGQLVASMIADNDLHAFRPNQLVEYALPD